MYSMISTTWGKKMIFVEEDWKAIYPAIKSDHFWMVRLCKRVLFSYLHSSLSFVSSTKKYDITVWKPEMLERTPQLGLGRNIQHRPAHSEVGGAGPQESESWENFLEWKRVTNQTLFLGPQLRACDVSRRVEGQALVPTGKPGLVASWCHELA